MTTFWGKKFQIGHTPHMKKKIKKLCIMFEGYPFLLNHLSLVYVFHDPIRITWISGVRKHVFFSFLKKWTKTTITNFMKKKKQCERFILHAIRLKAVRGKWTNLISGEDDNFIHEWRYILVRKFWFIIRIKSSSYHHGLTTTKCCDVDGITAV